MLSPCSNVKIPLVQSEDVDQGQGLTATARSGPIRNQSRSIHTSRMLVASRIASRILCNVSTVDHCGTTVTAIVLPEDAVNAVNVTLEACVMCVCSCSSTVTP